MSAIYKRLDLGPKSLVGRVALFDDGRHGDGDRLDGLYRGLWQEGLPPGGTIEFFFQVRSDHRETSITPNAPFFARPDERITNYTLSLAETPSPLQISEVVALNENGIVDEQGERTDWVEIRNASNATVSLDGVILAQSITAPPESHYRFPENSVLPPGGYQLVFLDRDVFDSPFHAPFKLSSLGEPLVLMKLRESGVVDLIEQVQVPSLDGDQSFARQGWSQDFAIQRIPSPLRPNGIPGIRILIVPGSNTLRLEIVPPTRNAMRLERSHTLHPDSWESLFVPIPGLEFEYEVPFDSQSYFRLRAIE